MQLRLLSRTKRSNLFRAIVLILMFLGALNVIDRYYYFVYAAFAVFLITPDRKIRFNYSTAFLLVFGISFAIFSPNVTASITSMLKPFIFLIAYTMGVSLLDKHSPYAQDSRHVRRIIYAVAGGAFVHFLLNLLTNWGSLFRNTIDIWTQSVLSATGQAALASMCVGLSAAFIFSKVSKPKKILAICLLATVFTYNLILAGRTLLYLSVIMCAIALIYYTMYHKKQTVKTVLAVIAGLLLLVVLYNLNIFGIKDAIESTNFYQRFWGVNSEEFYSQTRFNLKRQYIENMFEHCFGGQHIKDEVNAYAHDLYFDTYDEAGIFSFIALILYMGASLLRLAKVMKAKHIGFEMKQLVVCIYLVMNIQFWIEPILQGMPWMFASYCFIDGGVSALLNKRYAVINSTAETENV